LPHYVIIGKKPVSEYARLTTNYKGSNVILKARGKKIDKLMAVLMAVTNFTDVTIVNTHLSFSEYKKGEGVVKIPTIEIKVKI